MLDQGFLENLLIQYKLGGWFMHPIAFAFAVAIAIAFERFIRLMFQYGVDGRSFMFEIEKYVLADDLDGAIRLCNSSGSALLPKVLKAGLKRASQNETQIQNAVDAASLEVLPKLERRLRYLALIANVATLLGLLGTIAGLIHSFGGIAVAEASERQGILAAGISEALNCTAFGLIVAITTMLLHSLLGARSVALIDEVDEFGVKIIDLLTMKSYKHSTESSL